MYVCSIIFYTDKHTHTHSARGRALSSVVVGKQNVKKSNSLHKRDKTRREQTKRDETRRDATRPPTRKTRLNIVMFRVDKGKWQHSRPTYPFPSTPQTLFLPLRSNCNFNKEKNMTEIDSCPWSALKQQKSKYSRNNSKSYISICSGTFQFD